MADDIDIANEVAASLLDRAIARRKPVIAATGECLACSDPVSGRALWCSGECRHDWEAEQVRLLRIG